MDKPIIHRANAQSSVVAAVAVESDFCERIALPRFSFAFECRDRHGRLKWQDEAKNLVTTAGGNDFLTQYFKGSAYTAAWYLGLVTNTSFSAFAAADTSASHSGWTESSAYSNATRGAISFGTASAKSLAGAGVVFNINATDTIHGALVISNSTKGGTTGILYSAGAFASDRSVISGDTLTVTPTLSC